MNNKKKKETSIAASVFMVVLFLFISVWYTISEADYLFTSNSKDINEAVKSGDDLKRNEAAKLTIDCQNAIILDWYAETKHYVNGFIPVGKDRHCIIYINGDTFLSLTIKGKKNISKIDDIIDYMYDETGKVSKPDDVTFQGKISTMDYEIKNYFLTECNEYTDFLKDFGYDDKFTVYQLTLDATTTRLGSFFMLGFCIFMLGISVWLLTNAIKVKKAEKLAAMSPAAMYNAENSENNQSLDFDGMNGYAESEKENVQIREDDDINQ